MDVVRWLSSTTGLFYLLLLAVLATDGVLAWRLFDASAWGARWYLWRKNRRIARERRRQ